MKGLFWRKLLGIMGWHVDITAPHRDKCVICVAPHTSNMDFFLGLAAYKSLGREANFLMKKFWFFFPLKYLLKSMGGIPVAPKGSGGSLTSQVIADFKKRTYMNLAVTPEGTRSATSIWRKGFIYIALGAGVPIQLGVIDYSSKVIEIKEEFIPTGDVDKDMEYVKKFYSSRHSAAKYQNQFLT